ncbi:SAM-dependent methyltransferase [Candidatus Entotheonella palauensis]|nr:cyclopropane-fatty-acyl-phospholipid synthase family protein [Candidatus Entotheonella palauensis]
MMTVLSGASQEAIAFHYDVGNDFYQLWLDPTLTYTAALWAPEAPGLTLAEAQAQKIDFHIRQAQAQGGQRVLDIGCGWGSALLRLVKEHAVEHAVGLTLSPNQATWVQALGNPRIEVRLEPWEAHAPSEPYDAILSIEAFEAFARPGLSSREKIHLYRTFFEHCHRWLRPGGWLSLQTIAYGNSTPEDLDAFISQDIFPESDFPRLAEVVEATERLFEVVRLQNDREDYGRTLRAWLDNLKANRQEAVRLAGEETVVRYERFLRLSIYTFTIGACDLHRIALRRIDQPRCGSGE